MWKLTWLLTKPQEWAVEGVLVCWVLSKSSRLVPPENSDETGDEIEIPLRDFVVQFFSTLNSCQMDLSCLLQTGLVWPVTPLPHGHQLFSHLSRVSVTPASLRGGDVLTHLEFRLGQYLRSTSWITDLSKSCYVLNSIRIFHYKYCFYSFLIKCLEGALNFQTFQIKDFFSCLNNRNVEKQKQILCLL